MRRSGVAQVCAIVAILVLGSCSSSHGTSTPGTRDTPTTTSSSGVQIDSFTGPAEPPQCNAPTQVELHWVTENAKTVTVQINGEPVFARYSNGKHDELVPLACDGNPQTYLLTARATDGQTATKSLTITPRQLSAS